MVPTFARHAANVANILKQSDTTTLDIQDLFYRFTIDSIGEIAFGVDLQALRGDALPFAIAFDAAQSIIWTRFTDPLFPLKRWLNISYERTLSGHIATLNKFANDVIAKRRAESLSQLQSQSDLLSLQMQLGLTEGYAPATDVYLRDMIMNFMIAGRDTTAVALSWCLFRVTQHPDAVASLREEIEELHQGHPGTEISVEQLEGLKYMHAFVNEVLRLHPPVPVDAKYALHKDTLPDGTEIPAGAEVTYSPYAFGRSHHNWGPDAEQFSPDRWLGDNVKKVNPFVFPQFNAGRRLCLGIQMAHLEIKTMLCELLPRFDFELATEPSQVRYAINITHSIQGGLHVRARPRT